MPGAGGRNDLQWQRPIDKKTLIDGDGKVNTVDWLTDMAPIKLVTEFTKLSVSLKTQILVASLTLRQNIYWPFVLRTEIQVRLVYV